ncbi:hypothetical protein KL908_000788 [Ogataea polymorpha]|nr:hypothetical protein KL908_000788 [Ogataea polymorpha]
MNLFKTKVKGATSASQAFKLSKCLPNAALTTHVHEVIIVGVAISTYERVRILHVEYEARMYIGSEFRNNKGSPSLVLLQCAFAQGSGKDTNLAVSARIVRQAQS